MSGIEFTCLVGFEGQEIFKDVRMFKATCHKICFPQGQLLSKIGLGRAEDQDGMQKWHITRGHPNARVNIIRTSYISYPDYMALFHLGPKVCSTPCKPLEASSGLKDLQMSSNYPNPTRKAAKV